MGCICIALAAVSRHRCCICGSRSRRRTRVLQLIAAAEAGHPQGIKSAYVTMLFTTPYFAFSLVFSFAYIFILNQDRKLTVQKLPAYPASRTRKNLFVVLGEVHHPKKREPVETPQWLAIPERGLYTGIAIFGAIGSGKTSCCMYPFAEQILGLPRRRS